MASPSKSPFTTTTQSQSPGKAAPTDLLLPMHRIKMIMKSSPEVETVVSETSYVLTKATELFIQYLAQQSHYLANDSNTLSYDDVSSTVHNFEHLEFLRETIPLKVTWAKAQELINKYESEFEGFDE